MRHPLAGFGYYGDSADFSSRGIENSSADFSMRNEVNADEDFGKNCSIGDFGTYGREGEYGAGFEGFGHFDHFLGYHDEGLGFKIKVKKPKFKAPKIVSKAVSAVAKPASFVAAPALKIAAPVLKPVASVAAPVLKPIASVAAPVLKPALSPLAPILATTAPVMAPLLPAIVPAGKASDKQEIKKTLDKIKKPLKSGNKLIPKDVKKLAKKAEELVKKQIIPAAAVATGVSVLKSKGPESVSVSESVSESEVLTPQEAFEQKVEDKKPTAIVVNSTNVHPLLLIHRRLKGETMSGFLEDLNKKQKKIVQSVIDKNKDKAMKAVTSQATNIVGKQLDKLSKTNPKAQQAITQVVATASEAATVKAKESLAETIKSSFDQNKKYLILAGGGLIGLLALKMFMGRKA
jgi:ElaB/YqjD/DUF883 family membrane-anchored ribosome-binding protein